MRTGLVVVSLALAIAGCTETVDMVAANPQAQAAGGTPRLYFSRGVPFGIAKIVMPDGENLPAEYRIDEAYSATPSGPGGNFHASGRGPRTRVTCLGTIIGGHGTAECRTQDGALYTMTL